MVHNLHFHGGRYGIVTEKTSPAWQFTVIDSTFEGQRSAAISSAERVRRIGGTRVGGGVVVTVAKS